jgi:hypothetical protein
VIVQFFGILRVEKSAKFTKFAKYSMQVRTYRYMAKTDIGNTEYHLLPFTDQIANGQNTENTCYHGYVVCKSREQNLLIIFFTCIGQNMLVSLHVKESLLSQIIYSKTSLNWTLRKPALPEYQPIS